MFIITTRDRRSVCMSLILVGTWMVGYLLGIYAFTSWYISGLFFSTLIVASVWWINLWQSQISTIRFNSDYAREVNFPTTKHAKRLLLALWAFGTFGIFFLGTIGIILLGNDIPEDFTLALWDVLAYETIGVTLLLTYLFMGLLYFFSLINQLLQHIKHKNG